MPNPDTCQQAIADRERMLKEGSMCKGADCAASCQESTPCNWIGNGVYRACLSSGGRAEQRVYDALSAGKHTRIGSDAYRLR